MIRHLPPFALAFALFVASAPALAAERTYSIGSFDRIRVEGPFDVRLMTNASPGASAEGDPKATQELDIRVEGTTLIIRAGLSGWGEQPRAGATGAPVISVSTGMIRRVTVIGGGRLTIAGPLRGQRIDLSLTGSGSLAVSGIEADQLFVTLLGSGDIALAGKAAKVNLNTSGPGTIAAARLTASDLILRLDGNGETHATALYTADVTTTGIGAATVYGKPACTVKAVAGGPVSCGQLPPP
ncbi:MAG: head GIN domain-containing protein [Sphingomonas sp.]